MDMYQEPKVEDLFLINQLAIGYESDGDLSILNRSMFTLADKDDSYKRDSFFIEGDFNLLASTFRADGWMEVIPKWNINTHQKVFLLESDGDSTIITAHRVRKNHDGTSDEYVRLTMISSDKGNKLEFFLNNLFKKVTLIEIIRKYPDEIIKILNGGYNGIYQETGKFRNTKPFGLLTGFNVEKFLSDIDDLFIFSSRERVMINDHECLELFIFEDMVLVFSNTTDLKIIGYYPVFDIIYDADIGEPGLIAKVKEKLNLISYKPYVKPFNRLFTRG